MTDYSQISKGEYETLSEFRYAIRRFMRFSETAASEVGLTPQQHQALLTIMGYTESRQININALAKRLQIQQHSAVGLVNRLETEKLIIRSPDPNDHRKVIISLTERGLSILEKLSIIHREELRRLSPHLRPMLEELARLGGDGEQE